MYCDIEEMLCFLFDFSSDTVESVHSVHSHHAVYANSQSFFCGKFDTVAKFNESVHSSLDALSVAVVGRPGDLLEASPRHF